MDKTKAVTLTPNQVIAHNLARAREWKDWTQEQAATELAPYLGTRWSKATFSAAERSVDGKVVRQFTGDDLVAFARCFEVPIGWFFMPPRTPDEHGRPVRLATPDIPDGAEWSVIIDLVFGEPGSEPLVGLRLEEYLDDADGREVSEGERRAGLAAALRVASLVQAGSDGLDRWRSQLMEIAGHLDNLISLAGLARLAEPAEANRLNRLAEAEGGPHIRYEPPISKPEKRTKPA
ncbi:MAG TPA: helix-turn-helix transcriptional regulator [Acidimicrobiales bacterium]|nr:helix-turn-helix transcriptional regulator [Acidimicrobiales bacterium]